MRTFELYIDDDRYLVPTLQILLAEDEARVRDTAGGLLEESLHYRGVEVCEAGQPMFTLDARRRPSMADGTDFGLAAG